MQRKNTLNFVLLFTVTQFSKDGIKKHAKNELISQC